MVVLLPTMNVGARSVQQRGVSQHLPRDKPMQRQAALVEADMVAVNPLHAGVIAQTCRRSTAREDRDPAGAFWRVPRSETLRHLYPPPDRGESAGMTNLADGLGSIGPSRRCRAPIRVPAAPWRCCARARRWSAMPGAGPTRNGGFRSRRAACSACAPSPSNSPAPWCWMRSPTHPRWTTMCAAVCRCWKEQRRARCISVTTSPACATTGRWRCCTARPPRRRSATPKPPA